MNEFQQTFITELEKRKQQRKAENQKIDYKKKTIISAIIITIFIVLEIYLFLITFKQTMTVTQMKWLLYAHEGIIALFIVTLYKYRTDYYTDVILKL